MNKYKLFFYIFICWLFFLVQPIHVLGQTLVFQEQFDSQIPNDFLLYNDGYIPHADVSEYTDAWIFKNDPQNSLNGTASATSYFSTPRVTNRWLITPSITLGNVGNVLAWAGKSHDASFAESYIVLLSTTNSNKENFNDTLFVVQNEPVDWTSHAVDLSKLGHDGKTVQIAFVLATIDGFKFYLDSIKITSDNPPNSVPDPEPITPMPPPNNLDIQQIDWLKSIELYPNPTTNHITIKSNIAIDNIRVQDASGRIILETNQRTIDMQNFNSGVYLIEINSKYGTATQRLTKY